MTAAFVSLLLAVATLPPTVAIVPPVAENAESAWVGMALGDDLTARLLVHSRFDP